MEFEQIISNTKICEHYKVNNQNICVGTADYTEESLMRVLKIFERLMTQYGFNAVMDKYSYCNATNLIENDTYSIWFQDGTELFHLSLISDGKLITVTKKVDDLIKVITENINEISSSYYNIYGHSVSIENATSEIINNYKIMVNEYGFIGHDNKLENIQHVSEFYYNGKYGFYYLVGGYEGDSDYDIITSDFNVIIWYMHYEFGMYKEFD